MRKYVMVLFFTVAVIMPLSAITAEPKSPNLAHCDGKHRRTANPYGTILPTVDPLTSSSSSAHQTQRNAEVDVFPGKASTPNKSAGESDKTSRQVPPISSTPRLANYRSC